MPAPLAAPIAAVGAAAGQPASPHGYGLALLAGGAVHACNGALYARMPAPLPAELPPVLVPHAMLQAAAQALPQTATATFTRTASHLILRGGGFSARLPALPASECAWLPAVCEPQARMPASLQRAVQVCAPFMGTAQAWMAGVRFETGFALATDGLCAIRAAAETLAWPACTIPAAAVRLLCAHLDATPLDVGMHCDGYHATWHFADGFVLRSSLIDGPWPRAHGALFATRTLESMPPVPARLLEAVRAVTPFALPETQPLIHLDARGAVLASAANEGDEDAAVEGFAPGVLNGTYSAEALGRVLEIATHADWSAAPACWGAPEIDGLLVGTRG